jgi:hypothetical protein
MTVQLAQDGTILLIGDCSAEDADLLLQHLLKQPSCPVDWAACTSAHTAVVQVLLCAARVPGGVPKFTFLNDFIGPALDRAGNK